MVPTGLVPNGRGARMRIVLLKSNDRSINVFVSSFGEVHMKKFQVLTTALAAAAFLAGCGGNEAGNQASSRAHSNPF